MSESRPSCLKTGSTGSANYWSSVSIPSILPRHIAVCMDGNRRWSRQHNCSFEAAYHEAQNSAERLIDSCRLLGISALTLFVFSTENWKRSFVEVNVVMVLIEEMIRRRLLVWKMRNIRLKFIGSKNRLSTTLQELITNAESETRGNDGLLLTLALNYGGRQDLVQCIQRIGQEAKDGSLNPEDIDEEVIRSRLQSYRAFGEIGEPDLFIRSGGEKRMSNFMIWDLSYTEFYFDKTLWPDFQNKHFLAALREFSQRQRRFGR